MLEQQTVSFTSLAKLNDLNEGMFNLAPASNPNGLSERAHKLFCDMTGYSESAAPPPDVLRGLLKVLGLTQNAFEMVEKRTAWFITRAMLSNFGILSLSSVKDNLLLWGHYTDGGKGFAVGIDDSAQVLCESEYGGITGLHPVIYSQPRPVMIQDTEVERIKAAVFTKSADWSYEKEIRCVRKVWNKEVRTVVPFLPENIRQIIIGPSMALANAERCHEIHAKTFPHAELLHAVPNPEKFEMDFHAAPPIRYLKKLWETPSKRPPLKPPK